MIIDSIGTWIDGNNDGLPDGDFVRREPGSDGSREGFPVSKFVAGYSDGLEVIRSSVGCSF